MNGQGTYDYLTIKLVITEGPEKQDVRGAPPGALEVNLHARELGEVFREQGQVVQSDRPICPLQHCRIFPLDGYIPRSNIKKKGTTHSGFL